MAWLLSKLFPVRLPKLHPLDDMPEIIKYHNRLTRRLPLIRLWYE